MPTSEPPRDFSERDSHISPPSTESDFHIPDNVKPKKVEHVEREIEDIVRKTDTNRETTQYLLITNLSDALRDYLLNKTSGGVRLAFDDHSILLRIMPSMQHELFIGDFCALFT
ncbi:hypothetical protein N7501_008131 [Penicillium viridicatum]|nr:hypothetical protein N7501_008131 [Penicillium viridicatum]